MLTNLRANTVLLTDEEFEGAIDEYFVTLLSNGKEVELVPGGAQRRVTKTNLAEYIRQVVNARIYESKEQMKAVKEGVEFVIPMGLVKMFNWKMVESRATGSKNLDVAKLKSIT